MAAVAVAAANARAATKKSRPNVVLITADDLHGEAMGWAGGADGNTPNLDALARQSFGFLNLHASAPICQPSREALMTGLVPHRNGGVGFNPVRLDVTTMPEVLAANGYFTAGLNKLKHMAPAQKFAWNWARDRAPAPDGVMWRSLPEESNRNPANYRRDVLDAIHAAEAAGKPFFLNTNIVDPHRPFYRTEADIEMGGVEWSDLVVEPFFPGFLDDLPPIRQEVRRYHRSARRCDASVGVILEALSEARVLDDTVVLFVADHGMPFPFSKTTLYQGGTHTPCLVRWQGIASGRVDRSHWLSNVDIMPTVLELLDIEPPAGLDGRSFVPLLSGTIDPTRRSVCTHVTSTATGDSFPSRCWRTAELSYIWNAWSNGRRQFRNESMLGQAYPAMVEAAKTVPILRERVRTYLYRNPDELYRLSTDPWERTNLAAEAPHRGDLALARAQLHAHMAATADPLLPQFEAFLSKAG